MAGLGFDDFFPRVIPSKTHAIIDYIHAGTNFVAGAMFLKRENTAAATAAFALGGSVLANALMTDYELGAFRVWSFKVHGMLDYGVAATSAAIPALLGNDDPAATAYFYGQGAGESVIAGISNYDDNSGSQSSRDWIRDSFGQGRAA